MNYERFHFEKVTSTNDYAKELLQKYSCVFVTADFQTKGRGRNKNQWFGDYGQNVYFSFGIRHPNLKQIEEIAYLQGLGAVATLRALQHLAPEVKFVLKYPNDVYAKCNDGRFRKISGILVEHQFVGEKCVSSVLGIGVNVNQAKFDEQLDDSAVSLKLLGLEKKVEDVVQLLISNIVELMSLFPEEVFQLWVDNLEIVGKDINVITRGIVCKVEGIDSIGRLIAVAKENFERLLIDDGDSIRYEFE